jgi:hypothetical protein
LVDQHRVGRQFECLGPTRAAVIRESFPGALYTPAHIRTGHARDKLAVLHHVAFILVRQNGGFLLCVVMGAKEIDAISPGNVL